MDVKQNGAWPFRPRMEVASGIFSLFSCLVVGTPPLLKPQKGMSYGFENPICFLMDFTFKIKLHQPRLTK